LGAISHIEIWNMMIEENIKYAIMEDDNKIYNKDTFLLNYNDVLKNLKIKNIYLYVFML